MWLHLELVKFNRTIRLLSKGNVHGIGETDDIYHSTVISCDGEGGYLKIKETIWAIGQLLNNKLLYLK